MAWPASAIDNVDFSGADIYVEGRKVGATLGETAVTYTPTVRQYYAGYPSRVRGAEVTSERLTMHFAAIELTPDNILLTSPSATKTSIAGQDTIHLATSTQPAVYSNIILRKYNPGNSKHYVFKIWRAQITRGISYECSQGADSLIMLDVALEALPTSNHGSDYLGVLEIYDSWSPPS